MRISADSKSADWHPVAMHAKVFLDGVELTHVLAADEERGNVIKFARNEAGRIIVNQESGEAQVLCVHGAVRIEVPDQHKHLLTEFPFGPMDTHKVTVGDWEPVNAT